MILFAFQLSFKATLHYIPGDILLHDINVPAIPDVLLKLQEILTTHLLISPYLFSIFTADSQTIWEITQRILNKYLGVTIKKQENST